MTQQAKEALQKAALVITTERLYTKLGHLNPNTISKPILAIVPFIKEQQTQLANLCVLVSGDVGFFSISNLLQTALPEHCFEFISGISSLQALTAKLGINYDDMKMLSAHGRELNLIPQVCYNKKIFLLTGGENKAQDCIAQLHHAGLSDVLVTIGENLSEENERVITDKARNLLDLRFENLAVMIIQNPLAVDYYEDIPDSAFIRGSSPMTKESIRNLSITALAIKPTDKIIDIGSGTGSVAIQMARKAHEGSVLAIEKETAAIDLIKQNINKFSAYNVEVKQTTAPAGLDENLFIDKAFIGGSSGNLETIIDFLVQKSCCKKIVVNAITLQTLQQATTTLKKHGFAVQISCINIAAAEAIGDYQLMKAQNPVYIISGEQT